MVETMLNLWKMVSVNNFSSESAFHIAAMNIVGKSFLRRILVFA